MSDIEHPEPNGDTGATGAGWPTPPSGGWTPPPPPPDWTSGWRDPGAEAPAATPAAGPQSAPGPYGHWQPPHAEGWGGWGGSGGWGGGPGAPAGAGPGGWYGWTPTRTRRSIPSAVTALLLVVAVLVGLGIGHGVWSSGHTAVGVQNPAANGSNGSSGSNGSFGFDPFGSGGTGTGSGSLSGPTATAADALVDIDTSLSYLGGEAAGTGIVLTSDGYILTNNHVISGATSIKATDIANGQTYTATVVGYDRTHDVAVVKLQSASGLRTATLANSSKVAQGEAVVGLGNAGGVGGTPSSAPGQVTGLGSSIKAQDESNGTTEQLTGLIETDCNIQPGDSGGALVNSSGQVVGMDTAASTGFSFQTQGNQGFAIPINQAVSIAGQIRAGKASASVHIGPTAFLGVAVDTSQAAANAHGAVVSRALPGGAAAAAGMADESVITALGGVPVDSPSTLTNLIGRYHPGDRVSIVWTDPSGQGHTATVTLASGPAA